MSDQLIGAIHFQNPKAAGVAKASIPFGRFEHRLALVVVIIPLLGFMAALLRLYEHGMKSVEIALFAIMYAVAALGIEAGYHRLFSHRSFQTIACIRAVLAILGSFNAQGPVLFWAAIHRRHHAYNDQPGDPHSPYIYGDGTRIGGLVRGIWHSHVGWLFEHEVTDWGRYIPDLLRDKLIFRVNQQYFLFVFVGLAIPAIAGGLLSYTWAGAIDGLVWGGLVRIFLAQQVTWAVNSICHVYGSRPFVTQDQSGNQGWLAVFSAGASWHNNHHAFPSSAIQGFEWWQVDPSGWLIRVLEKVGLAWKIEVPSPRAMAAKAREASYSETNA